jgi:hypothetical protein
MISWCLAEKVQGSPPFPSHHSPSPYGSQSTEFHATHGQGQGSPQWTEKLMAIKHKRLINYMHNNYFKSKVYWCKDMHASQGHSSWWQLCNVSLKHLLGVLRKRNFATDLLLWISIFIEHLEYWVEFIVAIDKYAIGSKTVPLSCKVKRNLTPGY